MVVHIIEDDKAVADALTVALDLLDHCSRTYFDGETFMAQANVSAGHWVIVDLGLPGISGAEIVRKLKSLASPPRIIAISGKSRTKIARQVSEFEGLKVLRKPLSIDMLTAALA